MARITVVNDNPEFLALVDEILEADRYESTTIDGDQPNALEAIEASRPDLLMIDLRMGTNGHHGWDIALQVRTRPSFDHLPILICSADVPALTALERELEETQHVASLVKPFGIDELTRAIDGLLAEAATP